ncbi:MAG: transglycosylase SLT domain-containing protein [Woeseiaceae bacterium]|nr:transglycosylase SLT domain-containing protein [Woeseiaceae bacterium]
MTAITAMRAEYDDRRHAAPSGFRHYEGRLPRYRDLFREAGELAGVDWRLLAAIGYQESHWRQYAESPTGVRGIMMLTLDTAAYLDIEDRLDPERQPLRRRPLLPPPA